MKATTLSVVAPSKSLGRLRPSWPTALKKQPVSLRSGSTFYRCWSPRTERSKRLRSICADSAQTSSWAGLPVMERRAGRQLSVGSTRIGVAQRLMRCVMTTYDPDTLVQDLGVLRRTVARTGDKLALDCDVRKPGTIIEGDAVFLPTR